MYRLTLSALTLVAVLFHDIAPVQAAAVASPNGELGIVGGRFEFKNVNQDGSVKSFNAQGNVPLGQYFGLSLAARRGDGQSASTTGTASFDYDFTTYSASPFWRDPKFGLVGVTVGRSKIDFDFTASGENSKYKAVNASAYVGSVTVSLWRERDEVTDGSIPDWNYLWTDLVWYPSSDFLLNLTVGAQYVKKTYSLAFEHQLTSLPGLSYGLIYSWNNPPNSVSEYTAWYATVFYRFGEKKSLMRRYREDLFSSR